MQKQNTYKSYRIQLTGSQLLWVVILAMTSLGVSFYLGLVSGNSLRPPSINIALEKSINETAKRNNSNKRVALSPEELDFFNSIDNKEKNKKTFTSEQLDNLKKTTSRLQNEVPKTENSLQNSKTKSKSVELKKDTIPVNSEITKKPPVVVPKTLKPALVQSKQVGVFTLQVFTSSNKEKAEKLVKQLIESGYLEAYLQSFNNVENKVLYRVRIAKTNKSTAESLAKKVKRLKYIEHVQIRRL